MLQQVGYLLLGLLVIVAFPLWAPALGLWLILRAILTPVLTFLIEIGEDTVKLWRSLE